MKFSIFSESYLPWEEYCKIVEERENLIFIISTAKENLKNTLSRETK